MKMTQFTILSLLAVVLAMCIAGPAALAAAPNEGATAAAASPGATAIEKAAKDNKYLFIYFYAGQDANTKPCTVAFRTAMAKLTDRADSTAI